ncbi:CBU_0592 family membrane protein [Winogradskyella haliclonae]|uniref:CBU-0592-like domain-containing protein n=1 Tax=Winogradskyella haliclonae TaxID=2048558 RepID=A0ABQ2BZS7_9FLAO|nr:hypothetical protein GCM10011444_22990 [Winogradskyella haliclonae]
MNHADWIGFIGVFQILLAYTLNVSGRLEKNSLTFILLNLFGGILACLASVLMKYIPFIILEGVWSIVSLIALIKRKN